MRYRKVRNLTLVYLQGSGFWYLRLYLRILSVLILLSHRKVGHLTIGISTRYTLVFHKDLPKDHDHPYSCLRIRIGQSFLIHNQLRNLRSLSIPILLRNLPWFTLHLVCAYHDSIVIHLVLPKHIRTGLIITTAFARVWHIRSYCIRYYLWVQSIIISPIYLLTWAA